MNPWGHWYLLPFGTEIVDLIAHTNFAHDSLVAFFPFTVFDDYVGETFHDVDGYFGVDV